MEVTRWDWLGDRLVLAGCGADFDPLRAGSCWVVGAGLGVDGGFRAVPSSETRRVVGLLDEVRRRGPVRVRRRGASAEERMWDRLGVPDLRLVGEGS